MTLRLLVDECCPREIAEALTSAGHDAIHMLDVSPGAGDDHVAELSREQSRVLVTFDHGFGDRAVHQGEPLVGLVLLRLPRIRPVEQAAIVCRTLDDIPDVGGWLTIIERDRVRRRSL